MRRVRVSLSPAAAAVVRAMHPEIRRSVRNAIEAIAEDSKQGRALTADPTGLHRYKVRRYRIIYEIDRSGGIVWVVAVGHRRNVYEEIAASRRE